MFQAYTELLNECNSFTNGLITYDNLFVILDYERKYGYTEHFQMLIGEEGIFQQAKEAVSRFIAWLKEKITNIITKVQNFIIRMLNKLLTFFGFKPIKTESTNQNSINRSMDVINEAMCSRIPADHVFEIPYYLGDILNAIKRDDLGTLHRDVVFDFEDDDMFVWYQEEVKKWVAYMMKQFEVANPPLKGHAAKIHAFVSDIAGCAGSLTLRLNAAAIMLDDLNKNLSPGMSMDELGDTVARTLYRDSMFRVRHYTPEGSDSKQIITNVMKCLTTYVSGYTQVVSRINEFMLEMSRIINKADAQINITVPMDASFKHRLEQFFDNKFRLDKIIITNTHPESWVIGDDKEVTFGWSCSKTNTTGSTEIYINYRYFRSWIQDKHVDKKKLIDKFVRLIVHECRHAYDAQNGESFDFKLEYKERPQEIRAFAAEKTFVVTDADVRWVESIIQQIERSVAHK